MRSIVGLLLIVFGIIALAVPSITFFTRERVVDTGFLQIDWHQPHTIFLNPIVGIAALAVGVILMLGSRRSA
jgi:hypothetical protein